MKYVKYFLVFVFLIVMGIILPSCEEDSSPTESTPTYDSFEIETVMSVATAAGANPEIVRMVPSSDNTAAFVASGTNQLLLIRL